MAAVLFELLALRHYIPRGPIPVMLRNSVAPVFEPPSKYRPDVPHELDDVIKKALAHEPEDRYTTAAEFLAAMRAVVPDKRSAGNMATLIGELFADELPTRKTELASLLSMPLPELEEDGPEPEHNGHVRDGGGRSAAPGGRWSPDPEARPQRADRADGIERRLADLWAGPDDTFAG